MMARSGLKTGFAMTFAALGLLAAATAQAARTETFANGIRATFHDASEVSAMCVGKADGSREFSHPLAGTVALDAATRTLYPFDVTVVTNALADMTGFSTDVEVEVFILDGIPLSTASRAAGTPTRPCAGWTSPPPAPKPRMPSVPARSWPRTCATCSAACWRPAASAWRTTR
ncbi:MAG: hypothetical protein IPG61_03310 [bacterium]|nr:hypothetical protein [bacterium]